LSQMEVAATRLTDAAYSMQRQRWATQPIDTRARLTAMSQARFTPTRFTTDSVAQAEPRAAVGSRVLAAAALLILDDAAGAEALATDPRARACVRRANLNVRQCQAVAKFPYEQSFCLAKHVYEETGACLKAAAG
jgi:hypothetical protein